MSLALIAALIAVGPGEQPPRPTPAFDLTGYWKTRGVFIKNLFLGQADINDIATTDNADEDARRLEGLRKTGYLTHHLRLHPELSYADRVWLKLDVDLLEGVIWGDNDGRAAVPLFAGSPTSNDASGASVDTIRATRVWLEAKLPVGVLRAGRMPSHWGMGLLANSGDGLDADFGDYSHGSTVDRILFATKPILIAQTLMGVEDPSSDLLLALAYDQLVEDAQEDGVDDRERACTTCAPQILLARPADDVTEWVGVLLYKNDHAELLTLEDLIQAGIYVVYRSQVDSRSKVWVTDGHLKLRVGPFGIESEMLWITGKSMAIESGVAKKTIDIKGGAVRGGIYTRELDIEMEYGRAPGDDEVTDKNFTGYPFHADYNVGLLLYKQVLAARTATVLGSELRGLWSNGAVWNSQYVYPKVRWRPWCKVEGLTLIAAFLWARADQDNNVIWYENSEQSGFAPDLDLGYEVDLAARYDFFDVAHVKLEGGILFPGPALYKDVAPEDAHDGLITDDDKADVAWTVQARLGMEI